MRKEMSIQPLVSVIIPTFNRPETLKEAVRSVLEQNFVDYEIVIVNDAGMEVEDAIDSFADKRIRYIRHRENRGLGAARNTGIKQAKGKYIALLDDDDVYYPNHLEVMVKELERTSFKVVYTDALRALQQKIDGGYKTVFKQVTIDTEPFISREFSRVELLTRSIGSSCSFMFDKDCINSIGLFDETLTTHEDVDFWRRLGLKFPFYHINVVTAEVRSKYDGSTMVYYREDAMRRNYRNIFFKYKKYLTREIKRKGKKTVYELYFSGIACLRLDRLKESQGYFRKVLNKPGTPQGCLAGAYLHLGDIGRRQGEDRWIEYYRNGLSLLEGKKNKTVNDMFQLGSKYFALAAFEKSKKWLQRVVDIGEYKPQVVSDSYFLLGDIHGHLGKENWEEYYHKGLSVLETKLVKTPQDYFSMGTRWFKMERFAKSHTCFEEVTRTGDERKDLKDRAFFYLGSIDRINRVEAAADTCKENLKKWSALFRFKRHKNVSDMLSQSSMLSKFQCFEEGKYLLKKIIENPRIPISVLYQSYLLYGEITQKQGKRNWRHYYKKGISILLSKRNKSTLEIYRIASLYKQLEDEENAVKWFKRLLTGKGDVEISIRAGVYFHLGEIFSRKKQYQKAKKYFIHCIQLNPDHRKAREYLSQLKMR